MRMGKFREVITTEAELRDLLGYPSELVSRKAISSLDEHCRDFIARSPFLLLATADENGQCDASPRGDAPGFVRVLDEKHLIIPERPGNRRMDSLRNILSNPHVGILFMIPGLGETLRVNGSACLIRDEEYLRQMAVNGRSPALAIGIEVEECYLHCAKAFKRSGLWETESWPDKDTLPDVARMLAEHAKLPGVTAREVAESLQQSYTKRLY